MNQLENFKAVNTFVFDIDGVMTNSDVLILEDGKLLRKMSIKDGLAIKKAVGAGYRFAAISGGSSLGVKLRLKGLGVENIYLGVTDKLAAFEEFIDAYDIDPGAVLYMGDDVPDYAVMRRVGLPTCPHDAAREILEIALYISPFGGGEGCVRDVIEKVMRLQEKW